MNNSHYKPHSLPPIEHKWSTTINEYKESNFDQQNQRRVSRSAGASNEKSKFISSPLSKVHEENFSCETNGKLANAQSSNSSTLLKSEIKIEQTRNSSNFNQSNSAVQYWSSSGRIIIGFHTTNNRNMKSIELSSLKREEFYYNSVS